MKFVTTHPLDENTEDLTLGTSNVFEKDAHLREIKTSDSITKLEPKDIENEELRLHYTKEQKNKEPARKQFSSPTKKQKKMKRSPKHYKSNILCSIFL